MKVWLFNLFPWASYTETEIPYPFPGSLYDRAAGSDLYDGGLALFRRADELGFDGIAVGEHHYATNSTLPSPNLMAAAAAAVTRQSKIVILGNCIPLHHPVRLAEELAMLDVLSHGRLVSGFIRGGPREYYSYGVDIRDGRECFEEAWELIVKSWTEPEPFSWHSEHYNYDLVSVIPRPIQQPYPQLLMAANSAESLEWSAQHHVGISTFFSTVEAISEMFDYYRTYAQEHCGWTPSPEHTAVSRHVFVAPTDAQAKEQAGPYLQQLYGRRAQLWEQPAIRDMAKARNTERSFAYSTHGAHHMPIGAVANDPLVKSEGPSILGSPDTVIRRIKEDQAAIGSGLQITSLPFGPMPPQVAMKSLELFGKEVLPHLR